MEERESSLQKRQFRQGDVLLEPVTQVPNYMVEDVNIVERKKGRLILALGEATGHAHAIKTKGVTMYRGGSLTFLEVLEKATLEHEEHGPITIEPGTYQVVMQRQQDPAAENRTERRANYD